MLTWPTSSAASASLVGLSCGLWRKLARASPILVALSGELWENAAFRISTHGEKFLSAVFKHMPRRECHPVRSELAVH